MKFIAWLLIGTIVVVELVVLSIVFLIMISCFRVFLEWILK
jgi:hypothetical protein